MTNDELMAMKTRLGELYPVLELAERSNAPATPELQAQARETASLLFQLLAEVKARKPELLQGMLPGVATAFDAQALIAALLDEGSTTNPLRSKT